MRSVLENGSKFWLCKESPRRVIGRHTNKRFIVANWEGDLIVSSNKGFSKVTWQGRSCSECPSVDQKLKSGCYSFHGNVASVLLFTNFRTQFERRWDAQFLFELLYFLHFSFLRNWRIIDECFNFYKALKTSFMITLLPMCLYFYTSLPKNLQDINGLKMRCF